MSYETVVQRFAQGDAAPMAADAVLDMLVTYIGLADAVVLPPGCPTLVAHERQRHHPPEELRADAVVIRADADVERVLGNC